MRWVARTAPWCNEDIFKWRSKAIINRAIVQNGPWFSWRSGVDRRKVNPPGDIENHHVWWHRVSHRTEAPMFVYFGSLAILSRSIHWRFFVVRAHRQVPSRLRESCHSHSLCSLCTFVPGSGLIPNTKCLITTCSDYVTSANAHSPYSGLIPMQRYSGYVTLQFNVHFPFPGLIPNTCVIAIHRLRNSS